MDDNIPSLSKPVFVSRRDRFYYIAAFALLVAILGGTIWYTDRNKPVNGPDYLKTIGSVQEKAPADIVKQILNRDHIVGMVKEVSADSIRIGVTAPVGDIEIFGVITPTTKFYQDGEKTASERTKISATDVTPGSFVRVVTNESIGNRTRVDVVEIIKLP